MNYEYNASTTVLGLLFSAEQELISESEKHETDVPTHSFAIVSYYTLFVELVPLLILSNYGQFSKLPCLKHGSLHFCLRFHCINNEIKTKSMMKAQTSDVMICRSSGGMLHSAWQLTTSAVTSQAEHGIPPPRIDKTSCPRSEPLSSYIEEGRGCHPIESKIKVKHLMQA